MTPAHAVLALRRLQEEADKGWPQGFDRDRVLREAHAALFALALEIEAQPEDQRVARSKAYLLAIATPYRATVAPKRRRVETAASL